MQLAQVRALGRLAYRLVTSGLHDLPRRSQALDLAPNLNSHWYSDLCLCCMRFRITSFEEISDVMNCLAWPILPTYFIQPVMYYLLDLLSVVGSPAVVFLKVVIPLLLEALEVLHILLHLVDDLLALIHHLQVVVQDVYMISLSGNSC